MYLPPSKKKDKSAVTKKGQQKSINSLTPLGLSSRSVVLLYSAATNAPAAAVPILWSAAREGGSAMHWGMGDGHHKNDRQRIQLDCYNGALYG